MNNYNYLTSYFSKQYELNEEWYNLQKGLIFLENKSIVDDTPSKLLDGILTYLLGTRWYFEKMYNVVKVEWNKFYKFYRINSNDIKKLMRENKNLFKGELDLKHNFYGYNYDFNKSNSISFKDYSPTDKVIILNTTVASSLKKGTNKKLKSAVTMEKFNEIRGKILNQGSITDSDFRSKVNEFYRGSENSILIDVSDIKKLDLEQKQALKEMLRIKKEIDMFYNSVFKFIDQFNNFKEHEQASKNIKINYKLLQDYMIIKVSEFKGFVQIYNTYFLSLLNNVHDKIIQDKLILEDLEGSKTTWETTI